MTQSPVIKIGTHDGSFHTDDVLAVAILSRIFEHHQIIRTRDYDLLELMDIVVDVGEVYDHDRRRYDHHMRVIPSENGHSFSSAGLIWKHYAHNYLSKIGIPTSVCINDRTYELINPLVTTITNKWIKMIDLVDNGEVSGPTIISEVISSLRPLFGERTPRNCDKQFMKAVKTLQEIFERSCFHHAEGLIRQYKYEEGEKTFLLDGYVFYSEEPLPYYERIHDSTAHFSIHPTFEYVNSEDIRYLINPVRTGYMQKFKTPIPDMLLGMREEEILKRSGCKNIIYVHHTGFVASALTKEDAISFCQYLLNLKTN